MRQNYESQVYGAVSLAKCMRKKAVWMNIFLSLKKQASVSSGHVSTNYTSKLVDGPLLLTLLSAICS